MGGELAVGIGSVGGGLRGERAASDEVAGASGDCVRGDPFPEQLDDREIAVVLVDTGAAEFDHLGAHGLEGEEIEFDGAVVTEVLGGADAGLESVGSNDGTGLGFADDEVVADRVEGVRIKPTGVGGLKTLVQLQIKDLEAQGLG